MDQDALDDLVHYVSTLVVKLDARFDVQEEFNRQQVSINDRLTTAIERFDATLAALKDVLGRGNGQ